MRALLITLFIIGLVTLSTQTFRHIYVKWLEPRSSVLDKYEEKIEKDIKKSQDLDELLVLYDKAHGKVTVYEKDAKNPYIPDKERHNKEPYKSEYKLKNSIRNWESYSRDIFRLRFFWVCGFLSIVIGSLAYVKFDRWIGIVGLIAGFSEMIYWTCPFNFSYTNYEFERLLTNKLIFSLIAWLLLICLWLFATKFVGKKRNAV
ncbi:MAG: hypothetical protein JXA50_00240 [Deltaproteobacteria bacterium]|nr:hypothetical protein [Deltaproteobacteria bacterium]